MACIFQTFTFGDANLRVAKVQLVGEADLRVCCVSSRGLARGDALWFITRNEGEATAKVNFCSPGFADLRVCFVATRGEAGWRVPHRWRGRLG